jgi:hypothetical protein
MTVTVAQITNLDINIARWATRNVDVPQPDVWNAATAIIEGIDEILAALYLLRGRTCSEIRQHQDLYHARMDALAAERRAL